MNDKGVNTQPYEKPHESKMINNKSNNQKNKISRNKNGQ